MGRFNADDVDKYGSNSETNFFQLKDDRDTARVRFMYNGYSDITGYAVHKITKTDDKGNEKTRFVNCLRDYTEPVSKCPLCESGSFQIAKFYIPLYEIGVTSGDGKFTETGAVKIWERGKKFAAKMASLCQRYASAETPLVAHIFEIERRGKKGDKETTYEIYEIKDDDTRLEDLPEIPEVLGTVLMDKSASDMKYFLSHDEFPANDDDAQRRRRRDEDDEAPRRRRRDDDEVPGDTSRRRRREEDEEDEEELPFTDAGPKRRTPSRRDNF